MMPLSDNYIKQLRKENDLNGERNYNTSLDPTILGALFARLEAAEYSRGCYKAFCDGQGFINEGCVEADEAWRKAAGK